MFHYITQSLGWRLWLTSIIVMTCSLTVIAGLVLFAFSHYPLQMWQLDDNKETAETVAAGLNYDDQGRPAAVTVDPQTAWLLDVASTEIMYRVLDEQGRQWLTSSQAAAEFSWDRQRPEQLAGRHRQIQFKNLSYDLYTLKTYHNNRTFYIQSVTSNAVGKLVLDLRVSLLPNIVVIAIFVAIIGFGLAFPFTIRRVLRPLKVASSAAMSITPANLTTRLNQNDIPSEIKPLIFAFNEVLNRLEKGFIAQQEFLGSAAHELQTPLTLLRGQIELQGEIQHKHLLFREIDLMARQVRQLLHLAEVSESQNYTYCEVDRATIAADVIDYLGSKAAGQQVGLTLVSAPDLPKLKADKSALFILLKNLVENAINVSAPGRRVVLTVDLNAIRVRDNGCGIDPDDIPFLFDRYWRAKGAAHGGTGLGLAICREIAVAHQWRVTAHNIAGGMEFAVHF